MFLFLKHLLQIEVEMSGKPEKLLASERTDDYSIYRFYLSFIYV